MIRNLALIPLLCAALVVEISAGEISVLQQSNAVTDVDRETPPIGLPSTTELRTLEDNKKTFSIRCWQNGVLILEEANWSFPQLTDRYLTMRKVGNPLPGIYLIDFIETFCELKQQ